MGAPVRLVIVGLEISQENGPKSVTAGMDQGLREMRSEYAVAFVLELDDLLFDHSQLAPVCQSWPLLNNSLLAGSS
jgi:hypothetical protein